MVINPPSAAEPRNDHDGIFSELDPSHAIELQARAVRGLEAAQRGYFSVNRKVDLAACGFSASQQKIVTQNNPVLVIPIHGVDGSIVNYQMRPNRPRIGKGGKKPLKYEMPAGGSMCLDIPNDPDKRRSLASSLVPLFITEGAFKVDAGCGIGILVIGLVGVDGWRGHNEVDGVTVLAEWEHISLKGRTVFLTFDSDYRHNRHVYNALARFKRWLESKGATVKIISLPCADDGAKMGLDDFIADRLKKGDSDAIKQELVGLALDELPPFEGGTAVDLPYRINNGGIEHIKETASGFSVVPLTNFTACIIKEIALDDGTGINRRVFTVETEFEGSRRRFEVSAAQFASMRWAVQHIGSGAVVYPNRQDHAEVAIRMLSNQAGEVEHVEAYEHTGWRQINGSWLYLHAAGAITSDGLDETISVHLKGRLAQYELPEPPTGERLQEAVLASLRMCEVINSDASFPVLAAVFRSVFGDADFSIYLTGESGGGKSELAALAQQHFGRKFSGKGLPAAWSSTANALEAEAFAIKDAVFTVDDFVPRGSSVEIQKLQDKAERLFRGQGNLSGRGRLWADGTNRPEKYPRGLVISTGEDLPKGQSLRARFLALEIGKTQADANVMDWQRLSKAQADAGAGLYAEAMAAFIQRVAGRYEQFQTEKAELLPQIRELAASEEQHKRLAEIIANLTIGVGFFLRFAVTVKAISFAEAAQLLADAWEAFGRTAMAQRRYQVESEQTSVYRQMVSAAIAGGLAHIALEDGNAPLIEGEEIVSEPQSWGWRKDAAGEWRPQGQRIGWLSQDGQSLYLEPDVSLAVARKLATDTGESLSISKRELHNRLFARGLCFIEKSRDTKVVRKTIEGRRRSVLHTHAENFFAGYGRDKFADQTDQFSQDVEKTRESVVSKVIAMFLQTDRTADEELTTPEIYPDAGDNERDWSVAEPLNGQFTNNGANQTDQNKTNDYKNKEPLVSLVSEITPTIPSERKNSSVRFPCRAIWRNKSADQPVRVTGFIGIAIDGKRYLSIEGSNTAIAEDELIFPEEAVSEAPLEAKRKRVVI